MHVIFPMSGQGTRYKKAGYQAPKPLIEVNGQPMIARLLENFPESWPCTFILAENHAETELPKLLLKLRPKASLLYVSEHTEGPGRALLKAVENVNSLSNTTEYSPNPHSGVLVSYCDYQMVWDPFQFARFVEQNQCDACLISYQGFHAHYLNPVTYAYSRMEGERVVEIKEKGSFTPNRETEFASCGAYYFKNEATLKFALEQQYKNKLSLNGEFYTSLTVQALLAAKPEAQVRIFEIPYFFQWGTPEDLRNFEYWEKTMAAYNRQCGEPPLSVAQVLMPMAGSGSRFKDLSPLPKPFLPVEGTPMFERALRSLPQATAKLSFVGLKSFEPLIHLSQDPNNWTLLDKTPLGQALSTEAGFARLDLNTEVLVSSCDHAIVLSPDVWKKFRAINDCDAAIFTVKGFPGCEQRPKSFAYVSSIDGWVQRVSVKQAISDRPSKDSLLVGTFWFAKTEVLKRGIELLKKNDVRVNGELYLDSIFELLIQEGCKVREIPLDGYINWGDPDSYAEAVYWQEVFLGRRYPERKRYNFEC